MYTHMYEYISMGNNNVWMAGYWKFCFWEFKKNVLSCLTGLFFKRGHYNKNNKNILY